MATEKGRKGVPAYLKIGPFRYEVLFDGDAAYDYGFYGVHLGMSKRIKLDPRQADTELPQTLLHEAIHALGAAYEIDDWRRHKTDSNGHVTDKIDLMASALLTFLRENPEVVKWLREEN